jgi:single-stranded-DNA-specific exonuclease
VEQRIVGQNHLKLSLMLPDNDRVYSAIYFNVDLNQWPNHRCQTINAAYQLDINEYNGLRSVQLILQHIEAK